jgi:MFS family permease
MAAALCAVNFAFAFFKLPESRPADAKPIEPRPRFQQLAQTLQRPGIGVLVLIFFLATFCFASFETTLGLLVSRNFNLTFEDLKGGMHVFDSKVIYLYAFCGIIGAFVQGGPLGRIVKKMGEPLVITVSLVLLGAALVPLPFVRTWPLLLAVLAVLSIGSSLTRPPVFGLLSNLTSADEQGITIGTAQSAGSLARIAGPIFAGSLYELHPAAVYVTCGSLALLTAALAWRKLRVGPPPRPAAPAA